MKKALLYFKPDSRKYLSAGKKEKLRKVLQDNDYILSVFPTLPIKESLELLQNNIKQIQVLILIGGDGTFYEIVNVLQKERWKGKILFFNDGTIGDSGKRFGIKKSFTQNLRLFTEGKEENILLGAAEIKKERRYFIYSLSSGCFSDIPYVINHSFKKLFGKFSYYFLAVPRVFQNADFPFRLVDDATKINSSSPFTMFLLGQRMGGFKVVKKEIYQKDTLLFFYPNPGFWNGLLSFFPKKKCRYHRVKTCIFEFNNKESFYCLDGEKWTKGKVKIETEMSTFTIFTKTQQNRNIF